MDPTGRFIVGSYGPPVPPGESWMGGGAPVLWDNGVGRVLPVSGEDIRDVVAVDVNRHGSVVGSLRRLVDGMDVPVAWVYIEGRGFDPTAATTLFPGPTTPRGVPWPTRVATGPWVPLALEPSDRRDVHCGYGKRGVVRGQRPRRRGFQVSSEQFVAGLPEVWSVLVTHDGLEYELPDPASDPPTGDPVAISSGEALAPALAPQTCWSP